MTFLQALGVDILLGLWPCVSLTRRTGVFSPAATSANFCMGCLVFTWIVIVSGMNLMALQVAGIAFGITASPDASIAATHIYLFIIFLSFLAARGIRKKADPTPSLVGDKLLKQAKKLARRNLAFHSFLSPVLLAICGLHLLIILLPNVNSFYFTDRSTIIVSPILLCSLLFSYYSLKLKNKLYFALYFVSFLYSFTLMLGSYSRIIPLTFLIMMLCVSADADWKRPWLRGIVAGFCGFLTLFFLIYSLIGREGRDQGLNYNLVWHYLITTADPNNIAVVLSGAANVFNGVFLLAECIDTRTAAYSNAYQMLSLSPFPSFIDGWNQVLDEQIRINIYTPFSSYAEVYFFAPVLQVLFVAIYLFCVRTMTRFYARNFGWRRVFVATLCLLCWATSHQYPTRNVFRLFLLATILCFVLRPKKRNTLPRGVRTLAAHPAPASRVVAARTMSELQPTPQVDSRLPPSWN